MATFYIVPNELITVLIFTINKNNSSNQSHTERVEVI